MRNKLIKQLKRSAEEATIGLSKETTKKRYKALKEVIKYMRGQR